LTLSILFGSLSKDSLSIWERVGVRGEATEGDMGAWVSQALTLTLSQRERELSGA